MSKDKPEVGDVWQEKDSRNKLYHIISTDYPSQTITVVDKNFWKSSFSYEIFKEFFVCKGKAKAQRNNLFEVQDDII